jgi:GNAT superfamily N-acetyltransferase
MGSAFRRAGPGDAAGLVPLAEELGYPASLDVLRVRLARLLARADQAVFVAADGSELVGWVHVQEYAALTSEPLGLVTGLVVARHARGRGVGRALMVLAEDWARARGLAGMRLRSRVARREAHAFYRRLGYEAVKQQLQFHKAL